MSSETGKPPETSPQNGRERARGFTLASPLKPAPRLRHPQKMLRKQRMYDRSRELRVSSSCAALPASAFSPHRCLFVSSRPPRGLAFLFRVPPTHSISSTTLWCAVRCGRALLSRPRPQRRGGNWLRAQPELAARPGEWRAASPPPKEGTKVRCCVGYSLSRRGRKEEEEEGGGLNGPGRRVQSP